MIVPHSRAVLSRISGRPGRYPPCSADPILGRDGAGPRLPDLVSFESSPRELEWVSP